MLEDEKRAVIDACLRLQAEGSVIGTWGNVSVRVGELVVLTPSRVPYERLTTDDMVVCDLEGRVVESPNGHVPTSEREVHRMVYRRRADVGAVVHAHTPAAMAVSTLRVSEVPCLVEEMSQLLGGGIPLTSGYVPAERHAELGRAAAEALGGRGAVILRNHGPVSCAPDLEEALLSVHVVERSCALYLAVAGLPHNRIPTPYVASERHRYLHSYGIEG